MSGCGRINYNQAITCFKQKESYNQIISLIDDKVLQKIVSFWDKIEIKVQNKKIKDNLSDVELWQLIWNNCKVNIEQIALAFGTDKIEANRIFEMAKASQLIYPDNSVNKYAKQYLNVLIAKELPKPKKK